MPIKLLHAPPPGFLDLPTVQHHLLACTHNGVNAVIRGVILAIIKLGSQALVYLLWSLVKKTKELGSDGQAVGADVYECAKVRL